MKAIVAALLTCIALPNLADAEDYGEFPAPTPFSPYPTSFLTGETIIVPPYGRLPLRTYTTPPQGPFYNVPPYRVIAPY